MSQDYSQVVAALYKAFGDEGLAWVKAQMDARFVNTEASGDDENAPDLDEIYQNEDAFADGASFQVNNIAATAIMSPTEVIDAVQNLVFMAGEVRKFEEAQVTKRIGIAADRDIALANIKAQQQLLQNYLDRSFDERAENFSRLFTVVDDALETNNMTALAMGLESVIKLAASSPFKDLHTVEETAAALADPDHEWDF